MSVATNNLAPAPAPSVSSLPKRVELLAPAGDWECVRAAVENGADAIYFGLDRFNARMRAQNFTAADLPALMEFLHRRSVNGYVTFNTLVFANEMAEAEDFLRSIIAAGVDAAIVQDVGICRLIRRLSPDFPIHASTQMTVTSPAGVEFAREAGCRRVVLARECSVKEIAAIHDEKPAAGSSAASLEVFIHGALCVAYSGQCLTSEALGGRSANRGECAQACRLPYELISDGEVVPLGDRRYLLSPQDLAGLELLPELLRAGVSSLKIEGRLKSPEYVANITRVYRKALDSLAGADQTNVPQFQKIRAESRYDLEMAFSRGLHPGWLQGTNNQKLVHARFGKKRGVYLGEVSKVLREGVLLELTGPLKPGDGIVFDSGHPDEEEEGGRVYSVDTTGRHSTLGFGHGDIDFSRIHEGDKLWKTSDPELDRRLRRTFDGKSPQFHRPLQFLVEGAAGSPLLLRVEDDFGFSVGLESTMPLQVARDQALDDGKLRGQLGRLGGTPYLLGSLENRIVGSVILPVSELNRLRREVVRQLDALRSQPRRWTFAKPSTTASPVLKFPAAAAQPELIVLVRNLDQLAVVIDNPAQTVYCEFENPKNYREAVAQFRAARSRSPGSQIFLAPPRIHKHGEDWILKQVRSSEPDGYLVRNYDHLKFFAGCRCVGDYSLNVANPLAAEYFLHRFSLERVTASYDLNAVQLEALLRSAPPAWFEITIHQHMPMFHMEHCVFCAFLSSGTDYTNCGRPCDAHDARLRDRAGAEHPLKADAGCRNTVFNALAQTGAEYASRMIALGARHFRIEFLNETADQVRATLARYQQLLRGDISGEALWRELRLFPRLGVTRGPMAG